MLDFVKGCIPFPSFVFVFDETGQAVLTYYKSKICKMTELGQLSHISLKTTPCRMSSGLLEVRDIDQHYQEQQPRNPVENLVQSLEVLMKLWQLVP